MTERKCSTGYKKLCKSVTEKVCSGYTAYKQPNCHYVPRQECKVMQYLVKCYLLALTFPHVQNVPVEECHDVPRQQCAEVPEQVVAQY